MFWGGAESGGDPPAASSSRSFSEMSRSVSLVSACICFKRCSLMMARKAMSAEMGGVGKGGRGGGGGGVG
jgi:hypothetical protein